MSDSIPALPPLPTPPEKPLPPNACDAHAHIFGPFDRFPLAEERSYTPPEARFEDHQRMLDAVGFDRGVVVQGSAHGKDNRAIVDAVRRSGNRLRGIVVIDATITDDELAELAASGIAGARFTEIVSTRYAGGMKGVSDFTELAKLAPRLKEHGLHAQIFANCQTIAAHLDTLRGHGIPIVVDHMARIGQGEWDETLPEFRRVVDAVADGTFWAKLTMVRSSRQFPEYADARPFHEAFVNSNPSQLVFGSDWPFLNLGDATPDTGRLIDRFREWTGDALAQDILVANPARLYGFAD